MDIQKIIVTIIVLVLVILIGYILYQWLKTSHSTDIVYCTSTGTGNPVFPQCQPGNAAYGGLCYVDNWTREGGTKTSVCGVYYSGDGSVYTNCFGTINTIEIGDSCSSLSDWTRGPGWYKSAPCSCQRGGTIISPIGGKYCTLSEHTNPDFCVSGEYFEGLCQQEKCPDGTIRTDTCTCRPV